MNCADFSEFKKSCTSPFFSQRKLSRRHLVVTFVALLELVRVKEVRLFQKDVFDDIRIVAC